ncbi:MAG: phage head-tail connector protein [Dyadobacter sp.]|uniref:head-tail connector protein n=1 Tax=Dyadobacter sp. TaxID=1914288 RepID=UPI001AFD4E1D|nr:phage head-tail connector protein [Dyadobacter sp.]MBO9614204.1 phage head-tail connector protein [Dyadobacter sp.]
MSQLTYPFIATRYTDEIVSLAEAREWLRVDIGGYEDDDNTIIALIQSAIDYVEKKCNLSLGVSDYEWHTFSLPCAMRDTYFVRSITSIQEKTSSGLVAIDPSNYELVPASKRRHLILWKNGYFNNGSGFLVKFKAGFDEDEVPPTLLMAIRALIAGWFDGREDAINEKKTLSDKLIATYRIGYAG